MWRLSQAMAAARRLGWDRRLMPERTQQTKREMSAADAAYGGIIDLVLNSELRPGERTSVNLLAARLNLGRTPVKEAITRLRRGVRLADGKTAPAHVRVLERLPTKTWLAVTVVEGRTHLVRRLCEAVGHRVDKLARVRLGPVTLGTLPPGAWRDVTPRELAALRAAAGLRPGRGGGAPAPPPRGRDTRPRRPRPRPGSPPPGEARGGASAPPGGRPPAPGPRPRRPRP